MTSTFEMAVAWLKDAEELSYKKNSEIPYEYACWKEILFDVEVPEFNSKEAVKNALAILPKRECNLDELLSTTYLDKLYFTKEDNNKFVEFINNIDNFLVQNQEMDINMIETHIKENISLIFDEETTEIINERLLKIAFILLANSQLKIASMIYQLCQNKELLNDFYVEMIKKSMFEFYEAEFQQKLDKNSDNIFVKHAQKNGSNLSYDNLKTLLENMLDEWGTDG